MLKPREITKGNYFYRFDCTDVVKEVRDNGIIGVDNLRGLIGFSEARGIQITREFLLRNGFTELDNETFVLSHYKEPEFWKISYDLNRRFLKVSSDHPAREVSGYFEHIHQLQSASAMCGIEIDLVP